MRKKLRRKAVSVVLSAAVFASSFVHSYAQDNTQSGSVTTSTGVTSLPVTPTADGAFPVWLKNTYDSFLSEAKDGKLPSGKARDYAKELEFSNATFVSDALGGYDTGYWYGRAVNFLSAKKDTKSAEYLAFLKQNEWFFRIVMY